MTAGVDVIGDVHGNHEKLEGLLRSLGYRHRAGSWRHRERIAVFVGDLIDRGPGQLEALKIAYDMVEAGNARIILGNHEFNAVAWFTPDPRHPGEHLRRRTGELGDKHLKQHRDFLAAVHQDTPRHRSVIEWFMTIPLWLDLGGLRVVHACWDPRSMDVLRPSLSINDSLTPELVEMSARKGTAEHAATEVLLKGPEVELPDGLVYLDKDDTPRHEARYAWWRADAATYLSGLVIPERTSTPAGSPLPALPDRPIADPVPSPYTDATPVIFGHFWCTGAPTLSAPNAACVDYSAGKGGPLVAYRWDGETTLDAAKFALVE